MNAAWIVLLFMPLNEAWSPQVPDQDDPKPRVRAAALGSPKVEHPLHPGPQTAIPQIRKLPVISRSPTPPQSSLEPEDLSEIRRIRDRIGPRLFDGPESDRAFTRKLEDLATSEPPQVSRHEAPRVEPLGPVNASPRESGDRGTNSRAVRQSLLQAIENLDDYALELERGGEFHEGDKLRRLSRQIRQRLREMAEQREH